MARLHRFVIVGQPQHVIQRGNNREIIFVCDTDFLFYLEKLQIACEKFECELHAYVLMTNHVHLLITPNVENGISKVMQSVGRYYVQYFNEFMFGGKNLFYFFSHPNNSYFNLANMLANQDLKSITNFAEALTNTLPPETLLEKIKSFFMGR